MPLISQYPTRFVLLLCTCAWLIYSDTLNISICPQCQTKYLLNISAATNAYPQCINHTLLITQRSQNKTIYSKTIFQLLSTANEKGLKQILLINYQSTATSVSIGLYDNQWGISSLRFQSMVYQELASYKNIRYGILMLKQNQYMLPFNLISEKYKKIIVQQSTSKLQVINYPYQPFLDTFWNEHGQDQVIINWLPYFSQCQHNTSRRIYLQNIIDPWSSDPQNIHHINSICTRDSSWFWGNTLDCRDKDIQIKCILEQLNVANTKKQRWWLNTAQKLFYFLDSGIIQGSIESLDYGENLAQIAQQYYKNLIQVQYLPYFNLNKQTPNRFTLKLKISTITNLNQVKLLQATLEAQMISDYQKAFYKLNQKQAILNIYVQYLSNFQTLITYGKPIYIYYFIFIAIAVFFIVLTNLSFTYFQLKFNLLLLSKLILFPIIKGHTIAFFVTVPFLLFFFFIASHTGYQAISTNFNGDSASSSEFWNAYVGRVGLSTFFAGYFLLASGIEQTFKVLSIEQTKIIIEVDEQSKKNERQSNEQQNEQQQDKSKFIINNMNSHRKYAFICVLVSSFILLLLYYAQLKFNMKDKIIFVSLGYPLIHKLIVMVYRHLAGKQLIYLSPILVVYKTFSDLIVIGDDMVLWKTILLYFVKLLSQNFLCIALQILSQFLAIKIYNYLRNRLQSQGPSNFYKFWNHFHAQINSIVTECAYQKSIFYTNLLTIRFVSLLVRPFMLILIFISIKYNFICKQLNQSQDLLIKTSAILLCFIPIDAIVTMFNIKFFQTKLNLSIIKCLQFNKFKFNRRKVKWINDSFAQNKCLQYFYRQFQKFCFSSQLYLNMFLVSFSILIVVIGLKIILQVNYVAFLDPLMPILILVVWLTGNLSSIILNFVVIKLKFYQKKEDGKMRAKLENVQKILKKSDYSQYLQMEAVKNYFLFHCKQWIVENITKIFDKQDFFDNNCEFLIKYKHYKSLLKKKQIQERKKLQKKNEQKYNIDQSQINKQIQVIKIPKKQLKLIAKPLVLSWFYIAKQFTFLKSLVFKLKDQRKKQSCEFCSMNIELQVIEKIEFANIVNEYRILNVGRQFSESHFIQFYKFKQQFITVCIQCKDKKLYLQKKHLAVSGSPRRLLQKWLIIARSRLLHSKSRHFDIKKTKQT